MSLGAERIASRQLTGPRRARDAAAVALAVTSGAPDAIAFLALGGAFTSVMARNLVLLGISQGQADSQLARHVAVAIICYIAGSAVGARLAGTAAPDDPVWPPAVTRAGWQSQRRTETGARADETSPTTRMDA
jgi:hypothetical protein